jgi:GNAT superfamily N-acetyltransferase
MSASSRSRTVELRRYDRDTVQAILADIAAIYGEVYQEPPYCEGPQDVDAFAAGMPRRADQPGFRMVTASLDGDLTGFAFGHQLTAGTKWWTGATTELDAGLTREGFGRTFAIIELAVRAPYRRLGMAKAMHNELLVEAREERATLLVRPEASPAKTAYEHWGYVRVGSIRPWPEAPLYDAMVLALPRR